MVKKNKRTAVLAGVAALAVVVIAVTRFTGGGGREDLSLDRFEQAVRAGEVKEVEIKNRSKTIEGELLDGTKFATAFESQYGDELIEQLIAGGVTVDVDPEKESFWGNFIVGLIPTLLFIGLLFWFLTSMQSGKGASGFSKSKARQVAKDAPKVTFADVAGADEAVEELQEIKEFLQHPQRFAKLGAKIPKGVLLFGPPGTGKTLLARAVAGEAGVPFYSISGSDFVEMFVGVGASRVRSLFDQAKSSAPAIIFVDEIDAVGRHRGAGLGGGHDEREQTLNQLLVEMDGFDVKTGVMVIAATNRPDILDPALLRPGRFDRHIVVDRPDLVGRRAIVQVHAKGKPLAPDADLDLLARRTPGFTGADLFNVLNEAALLTARRGESSISNAILFEAVERVIAGPEKKTRVISDKEKRVIAYHESGHALVGHVLPNTDPVHKVSVIARGRALGWTLSVPREDKYLRARSELRDQLAMLLAGRTAEELIFSDPTTGASDDIERATAIARAMVTEYGMSDVLGPQQLGHKNGDVFLGKEFGHTANHSEQVASTIDTEVRKLIDEAHAEAAEILRQHRSVLDRLADALVDRETLDEPDLEAIFADLPTWNGRASDAPHGAEAPSATG